MSSSLTVGRLTDKVIDIECAHDTQSPTVDPSVHTILIGHSMGGLVAAETFLLVSSEQPLPTTSSAMNPETPNFPSNTTMASATSTSHPNPEAGKQGDTKVPFLFPHLQGVLAFDTPFLGLAPSMVAHGLEGGGKMASSAWDTASEVAGVFGWGNKSEPNLGKATSARRALPAPDPNIDVAAVPRWQSWGKYAMYAGAVGAVAAGGAAAVYSQREKISAGWGWAQSHLLFVGSLVKVEESKKRIANLENATKERGSGCANIYTRLGKGAREGWGVTESMTSTEAGAQPGRTFCYLPQRVKDAADRDQKSPGSAKRRKTEPQEQEQGMRWLPSINEKARDETSAHMNMFTPRDNPGFYSLGEKGKSIIVNWVDQGWYSTSDRKEGQVDAEMGIGDGWVTPDLQEAQRDHTGIGKGWEGVEKGEPDVRMRDADKENLVELEDSVIVEKTAGEA